MRKGQKANQQEFPFNGQNYPPTDNRVELEPACTIRGQVNFCLSLQKKSFSDGKIILGQILKVRGKNHRYGEKGQKQINENQRRKLSPDGQSGRIGTSLHNQETSQLFPLSAGKSFSNGKIILGQILKMKKHRSGEKRLNFHHKQSHFT